MKENIDDIINGSQEEKEIIKAKNFILQMRKQYNLPITACGNIHEIHLVSDEAKYQWKTPQHDSYISSRHMLYGKELTAEDIDFMLVEKSIINGKTINYAFIDYKKSIINPKIIDNIKKYGSSTLTIGDDCNKPAYIVLYKIIDNKPEFKVAVSSKIGQEKLNIFCNDNNINNNDYMKEIIYVKFLYFLRGKELPDSLLAEIKSSQVDQYW